MKILHVVTIMNRGGFETWLMQILRNIDRQKYHFDFLVHRSDKGCYDEEIRSLGSKVIPVASANRLRGYRAYLKNFRRILDEHGPYDMVHFHGGPLYGPVLRQAKLANVPMRIMHGHDLQRDWRGGALRAVAGWLGKLMIKQYANVRLGCSRDACAALFGTDWQQKNCQVLYYGIDFSPYHVRDKRGVRQELNVPDDAIVIGHVGRFNAVKNHKFIVEMAETLVKENSKFRFILVGDGVLRKDIEQMVVERNLSQYILFTGLRNDIPRILSGFDLFVLPSFHEGLPMVVIEAQAAGLCCLVSSAVPKDIEVVKELFNWMDLADGAEKWAKKLLELSSGVFSPCENALKIIEGSQFNVQKSVSRLVSIYDSIVENEQ